MNALLDAALGDAARGIPVYPVHRPRPTPGGAGLACSCSRGPAGLAALRQLAATVGLRLPGPVVATGGGGWHYWFAPTGLGNRPPRGLQHVDWRGRGGAVLAPPSRHASGGTYRWLRNLDQAPLPEVPAALRELLDPVPPSSTRPPRAARPEYLGHSDPGFTLRTYTHLLPTSEQRTRQAVDRAPTGTTATADGLHTAQEQD